MIYTEDYLDNGIRVLKKYLIPSLENQSCKDFTWILMLGNKVNMSNIKPLIDFNTSFDIKIIYKKDIKHYITNISKDLDILITTRIDFDDVIYYNAVNDVRKEIDLNKPIFLHGYNRGVCYLETENKYYEYYNDFKGKGVTSIFVTLILNLKKVNETISIYELGEHTFVKRTLLKKYQSYGIKELNYIPAFFDDTGQKFIYVRQIYSGAIKNIRRLKRGKKPIDFNLSIIYGK